MKLSRLLQLLQNHLATYGDPTVMTPDGEPIAGYVEGKPLIPGITGPILILASKTTLEALPAVDEPLTTTTPKLTLVKQ